MSQEHRLGNVLHDELVVLLLKLFVDRLVVYLLSLLQLLPGFLVAIAPHIPVLGPLDDGSDRDSALMQEPIVVVAVFELVEERLELALDIRVFSSALLITRYFSLLSLLEAHDQRVWLLADSIDDHSLHLALSAFWKEFFLVLHFVPRNVVSARVEPFLRKPRTVGRKKFVIIHSPAIVVDCVDWLLVLALDHHSDLADAPDVVGVSHVYEVADFDLV